MIVLCSVQNWFDKSHYQDITCTANASAMTTRCYLPYDMNELIYFLVVASNPALATYSMCNVKFFYYPSYKSLNKHKSDFFFTDARHCYWSHFDNEYIRSDRIFIWRRQFAMANRCESWNERNQIKAEANKMLKYYRMWVKPLEARFMHREHNNGDKKKTPKIPNGSNRELDFGNKNLDKVRKKNAISFAWNIKGVEDSRWRPKTSQLWHRSLIHNTR